MEEENLKRIIIDVDMGIDDYLALLILLYAEKIGKIKIEAIICSMGNTTVENVLINVVRLLEIIQRTDIPVYKGAEKQLILTKGPIKKFHGEDGFGDLQHDREPNLSIVRDTPAAIALCDIIINNPNEISLICVGPLTNLALAIKLYEGISSKIKGVWIMGGNYAAIENENPTVEYNFCVDPEAAYIVLECLKCPIFILPWEACLVPKISLDWRYDVLGNNTPALDLLTRAEKKIDSSDLTFWLPCDAFLCFCFLNPKIHITKQNMHYATVELHSCNTRGQVILERGTNKKPNVTIIERFNPELFKKLVLETKYL